MRARHEVLPLAAPFALCLLGWGFLLARPAVPARVFPQPRARVERTHRTPRPPSPAPAPEAPAVTNAPAAEAPRVDGALDAQRSQGPVSETTRAVDGTTYEFEGFLVMGSNDYDGDWEWSPAGLAWRRRYFYWHRAWEARRRTWMESRRNRGRVMLAPGAAGEVGPMGGDAEGVSLCEVFSGACSARGGRATPRATTPVAQGATVRREGARWVLSNGAVEAVVDADALCAVTLTRRTNAGADTLPALSLDTPERARCEVTETVGPDARVEAGGVAVAITWRGASWWQQAVITLGDEATSVEASVTRTTAGVTELSNLTAAPLTWTVRGREVTVAPLDAVRVRG